VALATHVDMTAGRSTLSPEFADRRLLADAQFRLDGDPATQHWSIAPLKAW
jgi:hypothetical protein